MEEEEEASLPPIPGFIYGYIDHLKADLPSDDQILLELTFRKSPHFIPTTRSGTIFHIDRRIRFPFNIKFDSPNQMRSKILLFKLHRITSDSRQRFFADFRIDLKDFFRPPEITFETTEVRSKLSPPATLTYAFAVYFTTDQTPSTLGTFETITIKSPDPPIVADSHVLLLIEDHPSGDSDPEDFDAAIIEHSLILGIHCEFPSIDELIVREWYHLDKSKPGYPGFLLAQEIWKLPNHSILSALTFIEHRLRDLRSTIHNSETAISYFSGCLCFAQNLKKHGTPHNIAIELCKSAILTVNGLISPKLHKIFMKSLNYEFSSAEFKEQIVSFKKMIGNLKTSSLQFLCDCVIDEFDCILANAAVIQSSINTLSSVLTANTATSYFTGGCRIKLPRFREVLLCVLAHDEILENPKTVLELTPLISPTFAYFLLCNVRRDVHLPEGLNYRKIERFANEMKVDLRRNLSMDIVFKSEIPEIPEDCEDLEF